MNIRELYDSFPGEQAFISVVNAALVKLGKDNPDFVYNSCKGVYSRCSYDGPCVEYRDYQYTDRVGTGPECNGCMLGQAFQSLGVGKEDLSSCFDIESLLATTIDGFQTPASWESIQTHQDSGKSWAETLEIAGVI